jgi:hypothetical protein
MYSLISAHFTLSQILIDVSLLVCLAIAWHFPRLGERTLGAIERAAARFAEKRRLAILAMALAPIVLRLSLLWLIPVPVPAVHDEFSYLLAADTFAHGRLTNPPHPMSVFFETIHVNVHPTYMSKYPPAQGAMLALGQVLGHPWIGVLLSVSAMCAATLWMLQGWFPARWALLGATLVLLRLGIFSYWMNSYWGGAVAATGGALVMGALPRIVRRERPRARAALLLGLGGAILANSRPFEGFVFFVPVMVAVAIWLCGKRSPPLRVTLPRVVLPLGATLLLTALFIGYYNWRGTGDPTIFPYTVNERTYVSTPLFIWQKARAPVGHLNPQMHAFYDVWAPDEWSKLRADSVAHAARGAVLIVCKSIYFFVWPELCVCLIAAPWILRDRRMRFLMIQTVICFAGFLFVGWFQPHYGSALMTTVSILLVQAIRHLRHWQFQRNPVGIGVSRVVVLFALVLSPLHPHSAKFIGGQLSRIEYRAKLLAQLGAIPGEHLVLVRYSQQHDVLEEWVYNRADIDRARVVWAREIPGVNIHPLLDYFRGRQIWLVEADADPPQLKPY